MKFYSLIELIRPKHAIKSIIAVFIVPVAMTITHEVELLIRCLLITMLFVFASALIYTINDIIDSSKDKYHPIKNIGQSPSGRISVKEAPHSSNAN